MLQLHGGLYLLRSEPVKHGNLSWTSTRTKSFTFAALDAHISARETSDKKAGSVSSTRLEAFVI